MKGSDAYYHVMSRTVGQDFLLQNNEKDKFVEIMFRLSKLFFIKIIGFSVMSNHFHILIKMETEGSYSDEEILLRLEAYYKRNLDLSKFEIDEYREKLGDISNCVKLLKQKFSYWYNRQNNRKGHFWSDRFKSVLIESGESLLNCLAYIDLNSVRANLQEFPEDYKWSSIYYRNKNFEWASSLSFDGIYANSDIGFLSEYLKYLHFAGDISDKRIIKNKSSKQNNCFLVKRGVFKRKKDTFSDCMVMGSLRFIQNSYRLFGDTILIKKQKQAYITDFSEEIFSVRRKYKQSIC
ncbi:MAG: transposase [Acidobacteriota bacterium]